MSDKELQEQLNSVWNGWTLDGSIGEGSYGKVYRIKRDEFGHVYESALKVITIPQSRSELKSVLDEGMDEQSAKAYFYSIVEQIIEEFTLMARLKGNTNIVSYEDHAVVPVSGAIGWNIYIRMEMLTPLIKHFYDNTLSIRKIIQMGIDICSALEICQRYNIIHRDVKPENIFVSELGSFKLGDFGIAKQMEKTSGNMSKRGTMNYMAPEVYKGEEYGSTVDIYSLGLVLYRFLNNNRMPFLPPYPKQLQYTDNEEANIKRLSGVKLPPPCNAKGRLSEIILKACAYDVSDRYDSAADMKRALMEILYSADETEVIYPGGDSLSNPDGRLDPDGESLNKSESRFDQEKELNVSKQKEDIEDQYRTVTYNSINISDGNIGIADKEKVLERIADNAEDGKQRIGAYKIAIMSAVVLVIAAFALCAHLYIRSQRTETPLFVGMPFDLAVETARQEQHGITLNVVSEEYSDTIEKGRIITQSIPAGRSVKKGTDVEVTVSKGALIRVPNLMGFDVDEAKKIVETSGLKCQVKEEVYSDDISAGRVILQDVAPNSEIEEGITIYVTVSKGEEPIIVPDVVGKNIDEAEKALRNVGLEYETSEEYNDNVELDMIISQDIASGTEVKKGATIKLVKSLGKKPVAKSTTKSSGSNKTSSTKKSSGDDVIWEDAD